MHVAIMQNVQQWESSVWVGLIEQYQIHAASESHLPQKLFWHDG